MAQLGLIPACIYPQTIKFILNGKSNHKEFITIYNPYTFTIKFKIKSNASNKYMVSNPHGFIGPKSSFDVVFTHSVPTISNCGIVDKFRVTITNSKSNKFCRDIYLKAVLLQSDDDVASKDNRCIEDRVSSSKGSESTDSRDRSRGRRQVVDKRMSKTKKMFVLIIAVIGLLTLEMLPLKDEPNTIVPIKALTKSSISFLIGVISCYYIFEFYDR